MAQSRDAGPREKVPGIGRTPRRSVSSGLIPPRLILALAVALLGPAAFAAYSPPPALNLSDGSRAEFTRESVSRVRGAKTLWSVAAREPGMPLEFTDARGRARILFYETVEENGEIPYHGRLRAVGVPDGKTAWWSNSWGKHVEIGEDQAPLSPVVFQGAIWCGRGCWLESLDPDTGVVRARHWTVEAVEKVEPLLNGTLQVTVFLPSKLQDPALKLSFDGTRLQNTLNSPSNFLAQLGLFRQGVECVPDFYGTGMPGKYRGYLDLHRFKTAPVQPDFRRTFEDFDFGPPETVLVEERARDPFNPYLPMTLAFLHHFRGHQPEEESFFEEALQLACISWHEPFWMGAECEKLGFARRADALYEKGRAAYFARIPSPGSYATLLEVLIHFPSQRAGASLFYNGHVDRALDLIRLRRQVFPFTEGDWVYHRRTLDWLRERGDERRMSEEAAWGDWAEREGVPEVLIPSWWLQGWPGMVLASWILFLAVLGRGFLDRTNFLPALLVCVLGAPLIWLERASIGRGKTVLDGWRGVGLLCLGTIVFGVIPWLHVLWAKRRSARLPESGSSPSPVWAILSQSPVFYAAALMVVYCWASHFSGAAVTHTLVGALGITGIAVFRKRGRIALQRLNRPVRILPVRHLACIGVSYFLVWGASCLLLVHVVFFSFFNMPYDWADLSHPAWTAYFAGVEKNVSPFSADFRFSRALTLHLRGDAAEASRLYLELSRDARALNNLGVLAFVENRDGAEFLFRKSLEEDPSHHPALYNLGILRNDASLIAGARAGDAWRVDIYQRYKRNEPMISTIPMERIRWSLLWNWKLLGALSNPFEALRGTYATTELLGVAPS